MLTSLNQPHTTYCQSAMKVQASLILYENPSVPCGGMTSWVDTGPFSSAPPVPNCGPSTASTGVPAGSGPIATGSVRLVATGVNVASPSYSMCLRVSQC